MGTPRSPLGPARCSRRRKRGTRRWPDGATMAACSPTSTTDRVFVNRWVYDGCALEVDYAAWLDGDQLRMVIETNDPSTVCRAYMPRIDLVLVDGGGATDIALVRGASSRDAADGEP